MTRVVLYGKPGCCLCDEAREAVAAVKAKYPFELDEVDVSTDPDLHQRYGERRPVVVVDGEELLEGHVNAGELARRLQSER